MIEADTDGTHDHSLKILVVDGRIAVIARQKVSLVDVSSFAVLISD